MMEWNVAAHLVSITGLVLFPPLVLFLGVAAAVAALTAYLFRLGKKKKP